MFDVEGKKRMVDVRDGWCAEQNQGFTPYLADSDLLSRNVLLQYGDEAFRDIIALFFISDNYVFYNCRLI